MELSKDAVVVTRLYLQWQCEHLGVSLPGLSGWSLVHPRERW